MHCPFPSCFYLRTPSRQICSCFYMELIATKSNTRSLIKFSDSSNHPKNNKLELKKSLELHMVLVCLVFSAEYAWHNLSCRVEYKINRHSTDLQMCPNKHICLPFYKCTRFFLSPFLSNNIGFTYLSNSYNCFSCEII